LNFCRFQRWEIYLFIHQLKFVLLVLISHLSNKPTGDCHSLELEHRIYISVKCVGKHLRFVAE
jgi:hypothetical protein